MTSIVDLERVVREIAFKDYMTKEVASQPLGSVKAVRLEFMRITLNCIVIISAFQQPTVEKPLKSLK